jgi:hypothetical protein
MSSEGPLMKCRLGTDWTKSTFKWGRGVGDDGFSTTAET